MGYVTYENLIQIGLFLVTLIGLVYKICRKDKKKLGINYEHIKDKKRGIFHGKPKSVNKRSKGGFTPGNENDSERGDMYVSKIYIK